MNISKGVSRRHTIDTRGFVIAATTSGVGKTSVASAVIASLVAEGHIVQPFKVGPDFVDPTYLSLAAGRECRNLDGFPAPELIPYFYVEGCSGRRHAAPANVAVVEGVMGLYDGLGPGGLYSTAWVASSLDLPVVLLMDARASSTSVAATAQGFARFSPLAPRVVGVIANRVSGEEHAEAIGEALKRFTDLEFLGWLPAMDDVVFTSRHLGLIPAKERDDIEVKIKNFARVVKSNVNLPRILELAQITGATPVYPVLPEPVAGKQGAPNPRIALASDDAFCFNYIQNRDLLELLGAEIVNTSPINDDALPKGIDALALIGGYPEVFADALSDNASYLESLRAYHKGGGVIYAECGGLLYLSKGLTYKGKRREMAGLLDLEAETMSKLQRLGYLDGRAMEESILFNADNVFKGNVFHYSRVNGEEPTAFNITKASRTSQTWVDGFVRKNLLAVHFHLNFWSCIEAAAKFLNTAVSSR